MSNPPATATYHWDFFGAQAEATAAHFLVHLDEFLIREGLEGCETGLASERLGHHATWCRAPESHEAALVRGLKPRRKT